MERSLILPKNRSSQALLREKIHSYETSRFSVIQRITQWKMAVGATNGENGQVQLYESDDLDSRSLMRALLPMLCSGTRTKQVMI
ncbi:hypothetical protein FOZG_11880 [Fusarium oxysporum Fo47]|uniref:Uncharacterized protein n=1 Tax=Fusarium oxysporum Fo47 TaxID=660027 RepID=W9K3W8_FUSOX|nr:hypothetical protein FOZG_11880 [Fusarium oxysporum Fo47]